METSWEDTEFCKPIIYKQSKLVDYQHPLNIMCRSSVMNIGQYC